MSGEDYIKLPNGKKIYLRDSYGCVGENKIPQKNRMFNLFEAFNKDYDWSLNSNEVKSIFDSLKEFANQDGNNELSTTELMGFVKAHVEDEYEAQMITKKETMKFLEIVQKESDKSLLNKADAHIDNTISKVFPELEFLNLGLDNNIDTDKLTFDEIKKHYPSDKYSVREETRTEYCLYDENRRISTRSETEFPDSVPRVRRTQFIVDNETGKIVVTAKDNDYYTDAFKIDINGENGTKEINIICYGNDYTISAESNSRLNTSNAVILNSVDITDGKIRFARYNDEAYGFEEGIIYAKFNEITHERTEYENGVEVSRKKIKYDENVPITEQPLSQEQKEHENISSEFEVLIQTNNFNEFKKLISESVRNNNIGLDMDEYFEKTGRELIDDIQNLNISEQEKKQILNMICEPYNDSKYYDAHKKIENSKVDNKYYTSTDEYSVEYNGPIINVYNKTSGNKTRINLKTLLKDMNYDRKKFLQKSLKTIQSFSGEVLENIATEISSISLMSKKDSKGAFNGQGGAAGAYCFDTITAFRTLSRHKGGVIVHETAHGMDDSSSHEWYSSNSKFKKVYDECIKRYVESGHRRFDDRHPMRSLPIFPINKGTKYATYNEQEAFAICVEILMGYNDSHTKFVKMCMPELIDAAKELYLEIRAKSQEERRTI